MLEGMHAVLVPFRGMAAQPGSMVTCTRIACADRGTCLHAGRAIVDD